MRDVYWFGKNGEKVVHTMDYNREDKCVPMYFRGESKGLQAVLRER